MANTATQQSTFMLLLLLIFRWSACKLTLSHFGSQFHWRKCKFSQLNMRYLKMMFYMFILYYIFIF